MGHLASRHDRGFTLLELMTTLVIAGILIGVTVWSMQGFIVGNRVSAAAREFSAHARLAATVAARANRPVELAFITSGSGCLPRYEIRTTGTGAANYQSVCLATEYRGIQLGGGALAGQPLTCTGEPTIDDCTLCTGNRTVTFFPSGEVVTSGTDPDGDSVAFSVPGETSSARSVAVGLRNVSGRTQIFRAAGSSGWVCK